MMSGPLTIYKMPYLTEIRILEMGSHHPFKNQSNTQITASFHTNSVHKPPHTASDPHTQKKPTCVYCKGPHTPGTCEAIKDHQKHLDVIKREKLCFNCLGHHKVCSCNSSISIVNVVVSITQVYTVIP